MSIEKYLKKIADKNQTEIDPKQLESENTAVKKLLLSLANHISRWDKISAHIEVTNGNYHVKCRYYLKDSKAPIIVDPQPNGNTNVSIQELSDTCNKIKTHVRKIRGVFSKVHSENELWESATFILRKDGVMTNNYHY